MRILRFTWVHLDAKSNLRIFWKCFHSLLWALITLKLFLVNFENMYVYLLCISKTLNNTITILNSAILKLFSHKNQRNKTNKKIFIWCISNCSLKLIIYIALILWSHTVRLEEGNAKVNGTDISSNSFLRCVKALILDIVFLHARDSYYQRH